MKRLVLFSILVAITAAIWILNRGSTTVEQPSANVPKSNKPISSAEQSITKSSRPMEQSDPNSETNSKTEESQSGSRTLPAESVRGVDFNSFSEDEKQSIAKEYKSNFRREFDPFSIIKKQINGTVTLSYRRYEGKFRIQFRTPATFNVSLR